MVSLIFRAFVRSFPNKCDGFCHKLPKLGSPVSSVQLETLPAQQGLKRRVQVLQSGHEGAQLKGFDVGKPNGGYETRAGGKNGETSQAGKTGLAIEVGDSEKGSHCK
jgi:hypothetical protein